MKVGVLAWIHKFDSRYSVAAFSLSLCRLLLEAGQVVVFLTRADFEDEDKLPAGVEVRRFPITDFETNFEGEVNLEQSIKLTQETGFNSQIWALQLADLDVVCTQDVMFNGQYLFPFVALKEFVTRQESGPGFVHWSHSLPAINPQSDNYPWSQSFKPFPASKYLALTHSGIPFIAKRYGLPEGSVRVVNHWIDSKIENEESEAASKLLSPLRYKELLLLSASRGTKAKQLIRSCQLLEGFVRNGVDAGLILALTYLESDEARECCEELKDFVGKRGFEDRVVFSFDHGADLQLDELRPLYRACDLFLHPSCAESFGLTVLEAAAHGCIPVLNADVAAFREYAGQGITPTNYERAFLLRWGGLHFPVEYHPSSEQYHTDQARNIRSVLVNNMQYRNKLALRTKYNPQWVWHHQLQPVFWEAQQMGKRGYDEP